MDGLSIGLQRLDAAQTKDQLVDALWDLRDSAYDTPEVWAAFTALGFLQSLAGELDQESAGDEGQISVLLLARALGRALDPRPSGPTAAP